MSRSNRSIGIQKNKLLRYQKVLEEYKKYDNGDIPITVIHRKYIFPKFAISRATLYTILATPVNKELKQIDEQLSLF